MVIQTDEVRSGEELPVVQDNRLPTEDRKIIAPERGLRKRFWAYLAGAVALLGFNFGGTFPLRWILGNSDGPQREQIAPTKEFWLDRPDGSRLHVRIHGFANAPTLLLTHGWSLDVSAWDYVIRQLSKRCRVVTWDLPGLGQSKGPANRDWSLEKMAHDLHAVLQATSTQGTTVLLGHSIGGMITQVFCRVHSEELGAKVHGLALLHTTYRNPLRTCFAAPLATALELPLLTPLNYLTIALAPWVWLSNLQSYLNGSLHITSRFTSFSGKQTWQQLDHAARLSVKAWPGVLARGNFAMQKFNEEATLTKLELPVLVLSGKYDRMTLPSASAHMEHLLADDRPYQIPTGHLGMWECPEQFVLAITEFVERLPEYREGETKSPSVVPSASPLKQ